MSNYPTIINLGDFYNEDDYNNSEENRKRALILFDALKIDPEETNHIQINASLVEAFLFLNDSRWRKF